MQTLYLLLLGLLAPFVLGNWATSTYRAYPELEWLSHGTVHATGEGQSLQNQDSLSVLAIGCNAIELNRTLLALQVGQWVRAGMQLDYEALADCQEGHNRLSWKDFSTLHNRYNKVLRGFSDLTASEVNTAAEVMLILSDNGKSQIAHERLAPYGIVDQDHDDFYAHVMASTEAAFALPSFAKLPTQAQALLRQTADLGHFGHMLHLEGGPQMWQKLAQSDLLRKAPLIFDFAWMVHVFDVAGARGHVTTHGSLSYTTQTHQALEALYKACLAVDKGENQAYEAYHAIRCEWIGLSPKALHSDVFGRLAAMMRLFTPEEGRALKEGFEALSFADQALVQAAFGFNGFASLPADPTYIPAVLVNLIESPAMGCDGLERIKNTVSLVTPWLSAVLDEYKQRLGLGSWPQALPLNFNLVARAVKQDPKGVFLQVPLLDSTTGFVQLGSL